MVDVAALLSLLLPTGGENRIRSRCPSFSASSPCRLIRSSFDTPGREIIYAHILHKRQAFGTAHVPGLLFNFIHRTLSTSRRLLRRLPAGGCVVGASVVSASVVAGAVVGACVGPGAVVGACVSWAVVGACVSGAVVGACVSGAVVGASVGPGAAVPGAVVGA